jgi:putative colanic acid biosynthesis UDP-glucose lipid carrier transferase
MLAYSRDTIRSAGCVTALCWWFLGNVSGLAYHYEEKVVLAWFVATPASCWSAISRCARSASTRRRTRRCVRWSWSAPTTSA